MTTANRPTFRQIEAGGFPERTRWMRDDGDGVWTHCTGPEDMSRGAICTGNGTDYDPDCSACYYGHPHTLAAHTAKLRKTYIASA
jgi:hypothetical protein